MKEDIEMGAYKGTYPIKIRKVFMGLTATGEEVMDTRVFMYLGPVRLDVTDLHAPQIRMAVTKLELMGLVTLKKEES